MDPGPVPVPLPVPLDGALTGIPPAAHGYPGAIPPPYPYTLPYPYYHVPMPMPPMPISMPISVPYDGTQESATPLPPKRTLPVRARVQSTSELTPEEKRKAANTVPASQEVDQACSQLQCTYCRDYLREHLTSMTTVKGPKPPACAICHHFKSAQHPTDPTVHPNITTWFLTIHRAIYKWARLDCLTTNGVVAPVPALTNARRTMSPSLKM
jgi:hypothetical protein